MPDKKWKSAIYEGQLFHERTRPKKHRFTYSVFMVYCCLDELDELLSLSRFWNRSRWAPACFNRKDFHGNPKLSVEDAVKNTVSEQIGFRPDGDVFVLANFRYFGFIMNPLVTYYCYNSSDQLVAILAEVTNTPWKESHAYALQVAPLNTETGSKDIFSVTFDKAFTVSPFNVTDMKYFWQSNLPDENLSISISAQENNQSVVNAVLSLKRKNMSGDALNSLLFRFPFHTLKVCAGIYWEALKLFAKGVPFLGKNKYRDHGSVI